MTNKHYSPDLRGFAEKLGLKNGVYDLIRRPVPRQDVLYFSQNDINGSIENKEQNRLYRKNHRRSGVKRR